MRCCQVKISQLSYYHNCDNNDKSLQYIWDININIKTYNIDTVWIDIEIQNKPILTFSYFTTFNTQTRTIESPKNMTSTDWTFDIAIIGTTKTGKTALMHALMNQPYSPRYKQTLGSEHGSYMGISQGETICLSMTSLSGQSRLLPITQQHLSKKHSIIITYSINNVESFKETQFWVQEASRQSPSATISLVGTMTDLASNASLRAVQGADATQQAKEWGARHYSCSSAKNDNINSFRSQLMSDILKSHGNVHK